MVDRLHGDVEYRFINPSEYKEILATKPLWYLEPKITDLLDRYINQEAGSSEPNWVERKWEIIRMFGEALANDAVYLDKEKEEFWNDDDRPHSEIRKKFGKPESEEIIDTVVIHHTATSPELTYDELNGIHLLRLYVPLFRKGVFKGPDGGFLPVSSGHKYKGKETFVGYHHVVRSDGSAEQLLDDRYVGFHAGHYATNCRSFGIAIIGDLTDQRPTRESVETVKALIKQVEPKVLIGHREVVVKRNEDGTVVTVDTDCPGNLFLGNDGWKNELTS